MGNGEWGNAADGNHPVAECGMRKIEGESTHKWDRIALYIKCG